MATLFGKLLGAVGIGRNANPPFNSSPVGILRPAQSVGILQTTADKTILGSSTPEKSGTSFADVVGTIGSLVGIAGSVKDVLSKNNESDVQGGELAEVTVTATKPNFVENIKTAVANVAEGKPVITFGQEFAVSDNLKLPIYLGIGLLAYKMFFSGRR